VVVDVDLTPLSPKSPQVAMFSDPEKARELQVRSRETYKAKRAENAARRQEVTKSVLGSVVETAEAAMDSRQLDDKTTEELADMQVRRLAKLVLLGGALFAPTDLREASQTAVMWSNIAKVESVRKGKIKDDTVEDDSPVQKAARDLQRLSRKMHAVKAG
jgi:hypothetical protein